MFDRLKTRVSRFTKQLTRRALSQKDIEDILVELETGLLESDVALEVVEKIIQEHNGRVELKSKPHVETTVLFTIPAGVRE